MSRHGIPIGKIFGISIDLDYSWFLIVGLLAWMLAASYYPQEFPGWSSDEYWAVGIVAAVMLFVSVLIHELAHSLMAQHYGLSVPRITLFLFGGVSQLAAEPSSAGSEFWITLVGPLTSLVLAAIFWEMEPLFAHALPLFALAEYLAILNLILAIFNLIPGFPLDGGRIFRAIVWRVTGNYHRATVTAGLAGRFFGFLLIFYGVWQVFFANNLVWGILIAFMGWYLESAAGSQLHQESLKNLLGGYKVADAMRRDFPQVPADVTVQDLVDRYLLPAKARYVLVTDTFGTAGLATLSAIREVPRQAWPATLASNIMVPFQKLKTTQPNTVLWSALEEMGRDGVNQLPVVDGNHIVGMLSREDIVHYLGVLRSFPA